MPVKGKIIVKNTLFAFTRVGEPYKDFIKFCKEEKIKSNQYILDCCNGFVRFYISDKESETILFKFAQKYGYKIIETNKKINFFSADKVGFKNLMGVFNL